MHAEYVLLSITKDNLLRKTQKSELKRFLEEKLNKSIPDRVPIYSKKTNFKAYARKVSLGKLKTFGNFARTLWNTFKHLSMYCQRIYIVFDLYVQKSIKQGERFRKTKAEAININVNSYY